MRNKIARRWFQPSCINISKYCVLPDYWSSDSLKDHPLNHFLLPQLFPDLHQNFRHPKYVT